VLKKLVGYAAYMFGANTLTGILTFAVSAMGMVTRPKEAFGDYAAYMLVYEISFGFFIYGANAAIQRYGADSPDNRLRFGAASFWLFGALFIATLFAGTGIAVYFGLKYALAIFGLPWLVIFWWGRYLVRSKLDASSEARLMMIASLSNSIFQFGFLTLTDLRDALIYGDFASLVVSGVAAFYYVPKAADARFLDVLKARVGKQLIADSVRFAMPVWWAGQIAQAKTHIRGVWTRAILGAAQMGAFQGMQTMWQFAAKPLEYVSQAALPGLVSAKEDRSTLYRDLLRLCLVMFTSIGVAVASGIPLVFEVIDKVSLLLGRSMDSTMAAKYSDVPPLLFILALGMPIAAFEVVTNQYSVAEGRQKAVLHSNIANVAAVLISIYPLGSAYGLPGIVLSGIVGEAASAMAYAILLYKEYAENMRLAILWTVTSSLCCAVALAPAFLWRAWSLSWLLAFPAIALLGAGLLLFSVMRTADLRRIVTAYRR
jgi:O-antigen/teichoic acid export membrane protein